LLAEIGAFGNPLFSVDCGTPLELLGVNLNVIPPVNSPLSALVFQPA